MNYLSDNGARWQTGDNNTLQPFGSYDENLPQLDNPLVNIMMPNCRIHKVPICRGVRSSHKDHFGINKLSDDKLNYAVDFSEFAKSVDSPIVQFHFIVDTGQVDIEGSQLADNVISFVLSGGEKTNSLILKADTESGLRKAVTVSVSC